MRSRGSRDSQGVVKAGRRGGEVTQRRVAEKNTGRKFAGGYSRDRSATEALDRVPWSVENRRRSISGRTKRKMTVVEVRHIARRSVDASGRAGGTRDASNAWWPASGTWNAAFQRDDSWPRFLLFTTPPSAKRAPSIRAAERVPTRKYRSPSISL